MASPLSLLGLGKRRKAPASDSLDTQVPLTDEEVRATWAAASWLISYPDDTVLERLEPLAALVAGLPQRPRVGLAAAIDTLQGGDIVDVRSEYVETFDTRRRGCLYLTYFSNGDTRKRGMALLRIKEQYRDAGLEVSEDELPDHLAYVLEFGAHDLAAAAQILRTHRAGLELLRQHLRDAGSPWHGVIDAVSSTLPALAGDDKEALERLIAEGPEDELVGLSGYGDGSADMPPMDMSPYAVPGSGAGPGVGAKPGEKVFIPLTALKGPRP